MKRLLACLLSVILFLPHLAFAEDDAFPASFRFGADVSTVLSEENSGVVYRNRDGESTDLFVLLKEAGWDTVRVRVWNDPFDEDGRGYGGGNCGVANAVEIARRCKEAGLSLIVDFHYSDFWADPAKQMSPKAWVTMDLTQKCSALYAFTTDALTQIAATGVDIWMVQVGNEINEVSRAPQQEGDPTRYVSRRARNVESAHTSAPKGNTMNQDDYDDGIQYVSVLPARKKSKIVEEVTLQTAAPAKHHGKKKKHKKEREPFDDMGMEERDYRPRYEDMDFEERAKQEHLDSLYDDEYYDDYGRGRGKLPMILGVVAVVLIIFLIFRTVSLSSKLEEVQNQLTQSQDYKQKYEDMQLENMQLQRLTICCRTNWTVRTPKRQAILILRTPRWTPKRTPHPHPPAPRNIL